MNACCRIRGSPDGEVGSLAEARRVEQNVHAPAPSPYDRERIADTDPRRLRCRERSPTPRPGGPPRQRALPPERSRRPTRRGVGAVLLYHAATNGSPVGPRRRPLLRDLRLPHHDAAAGRSFAAPDDLVPRLPRAACPAAAARRSALVLLDDARRLGPRLAGCARRRSRAASRGRGLRHELVADRPRPETISPRPAARRRCSTLVARDRGAVLPALAAVVLLLALRLGAVRAAWRMVALFRGDGLGRLDGGARDPRATSPFDGDGSRLYFGTDARDGAPARLRRRGAHTARRPRKGACAHALELDERRARCARAGGLHVECCSPSSEFDQASIAGELHRSRKRLACAVAVAATRRGSMLGRALDVAPLRWIGVRSIRGLPPGTGRSRGHAASARHGPERGAVLSCRGSCHRRPRRPLLPVRRAADRREGFRAWLARTASAGIARRRRAARCSSPAPRARCRARVRVRPRPCGRGSAAQRRASFEASGSEAQPRGPHRRIRR